MEDWWKIGGGGIGGSGTGRKRASVVGCDDLRKQRGVSQLSGNNPEPSVNCVHYRSQQLATRVQLRAMRSASIHAREAISRGTRNAIRGQAMRRQDAKRSSAFEAQSRANTTPGPFKCIPEA